MKGRSIPGGGAIGAMACADRGRARRKQTTPKDFPPASKRGLTIRPGRSQGAGKARDEALRGSGPPRGDNLFKW